MNPPFRMIARCCDKAAQRRSCPVKNFCRRPFHHYEVRPFYTLRIRLSRPRNATANFHLTLHTTLYLQSMRGHFGAFTKRSIATIELVLIFPAPLSSHALPLSSATFSPHPTSPPNPPAKSSTGSPPAKSSASDSSLIALPFTALVLGAATTLRTWRNDPRLRQLALDAISTVRAYASFLLIAAATLLAGSILAIVALHVLTD